MAVEKDFELLDDYVSDRLSGDEKRAFEEKLEADPELKHELKIQQNLVEGLRKARTLELKSMLNNIPVAPIQGGQNLLLKAGSWVVITGLVITGVYFYFSETDSTEIAKEVTPTEQPAEKTDTPAEVEANEPGTPETAKPGDEPTAETVKPAEKPLAKKEAPTVAKKPELKVYDPSKEATDEAVEKYEQEQLEIISKAFVTSSIEVETENTHRKYTFHYVFRDGKLILYGAFEKHLYEILEFISEDKRTVVLFYKSNYYLLDINKSTPTMLTPIKDRKLLKKLSEYRG
jgi:hypothetical protein